MDTSSTPSIYTVKYARGRWKNYEEAQIEESRLRMHMVSNDEKWYARFETDGKLYRLERSSLDDSFLEDLMNKCRNKPNTLFSLAHLKGAQCGMCYRACHAMFALTCHDMPNHAMPCDAMPH